MKVLLIYPANRDTGPYIRYYTDVFETIAIPFEYITWNRNGGDLEAQQNEVTYNKKSLPSDTPVKKLLSYCSFAQYVKAHLKRNKYDLVVVFTIQCALSIASVLKSEYAGRYILDIRDYSPTLRIPFANIRMTTLVRNSYFTAISSPAFKAFLPHSENKYVVSHNVGIANLYQYQDKIVFHSPIRVLTIGQIRDLSMNMEILKVLSGSESFQLSYSGYGRVMECLRAFADSLNANNVIFSGRYEKSEEANIVMGQDFINAVVSNDLNSRLLLTNRLYLSVYFGKPIIVRNDGSYQSELVKKYRLGVVFDEFSSIPQAIETYISNFQFDDYNVDRRKFIGRINEAMELFRRRIENYFRHTSV